MSDERSDLERRLLREGEILHAEGYTYESVTMEEATDVIGEMRRAIRSLYRECALHDRDYHHVTSATTVALAESALKRLGEAGGAR